MSIATTVRRSSRRLGLTLAAVASLTGAAVFSATPSTAGTTSVIMPQSCSNTMYHFTADGTFTANTYVNSGHMSIEPRGRLSYGGSLEQPKSYTDIGHSAGPYGEYRGWLSLRKNGELWRHAYSQDGFTGTMISSRWSGITRIVGVDNGILYAVTSTGGLNSYRFDGTTVRSVGVIGTKGWTTLKSIGGYARSDGLDSLVAVTAAGELVDYVIAPSGATKASYATNWKVGISQVSVGECDDTPGRAIFVVIGGVMYAYYDRNALGGTAGSVQDLRYAGRIGAGWVGLLS